VNEEDKGIHVIDNSNPSFPQNVAFINIPGNLDLTVKDKILYADSYIDLVALDISDPKKAKEIWRNQNVFPQRNYNGWAGDPAKGVVTGWIESDTTIEQKCTTYSPVIFYDNAYAGLASSPGTSSSTTPGTGINGSQARFAISNEFLYCLSGTDMLLYNIQIANQPVPDGKVTDLWNAETLFPYDGYLFTGSTTGVSIFDNSNPSSPLLLSTLAHFTGCDPVVAQGNYAYFTMHSGNTCQQAFNELSVIDISDKHSPWIAGSYTLTSPHGLGIDGKNLFVCDDAAGVKFYDVSDPVSIQLKQTVQAGSTRDVIPFNGLLIEVSVEGIYQFDYSTGVLNQISFIAAGGN
jgi:hypothetical protein